MERKWWGMVVGIVQPSPSPGKVHAVAWWKYSPFGDWALFVTVLLMWLSALHQRVHCSNLLPGARLLRSPGVFSHGMFFSVA